MTTASTDIIAQLSRWHLDATKFKKLLCETGSFIAGSFLLPCVSFIKGIWEPNDLDIWTMHDASMCNILAFSYLFLESGYKFPPTSCHINFSSEYGRFAQTVESILTFRHKKSKKCIQILVLNNNNPFSAIDIILNFDLTLVQMFFDGHHDNDVYCTPEALHAIKTNHIIVYLNAKAVRDQSYAEWIRTLGRIIKYEARQFSLPIENSTLLWNHIVTKMFLEQTCLNVIISRLEWWNNIIASNVTNKSPFLTFVPMFLLSVCPQNDARYQTSNIFIVSRTFTPNKYAFQITWDEIVDQCSETFWPLVICNEDLPEHKSCVTLHDMEINSYLGCLWRPFNINISQKHLQLRRNRSSPQNIVFLYKSFQRRQYMYLTSFSELSKTIEEVNESFQSVYLNTTVILSRENLSWLLHQSGKRTFEIVYDFVFDHEEEMPLRHCFSVL